MKPGRIGIALLLLHVLLVIGVYIGLPFGSSLAVILPDRSDASEPMCLEFHIL